MLGQNGSYLAVAFNVSDERISVRFPVPEDEWIRFLLGADKQV